MQYRLLERIRSSLEIIHKVIPFALGNADRSRVLRKRQSEGSYTFRIHGDGLRHNIGDRNDPLCVRFRIEVGQDVNHLQTICTGKLEQCRTPFRGTPGTVHRDRKTHRSKTVSLVFPVRIAGIELCIIRPLLGPTDRGNKIEGGLMRIEHF